MVLLNHILWSRLYLRFLQLFESVHSELSELPSLYAWTPRSYGDTSILSADSPLTFSDCDLTMVLLNYILWSRLYLRFLQFFESVHVLIWPKIIEELKSIQFSMYLQVEF